MVSLRRPIITIIDITADRASIKSQPVNEFTAKLSFWGFKIQIILNLYEAKYWEYFQIHCLCVLTQEANQTQERTNKTTINQQKVFFSRSEAALWDLCMTVQDVQLICYSHTSTNKYLIQIPSSSLKNVHFECLQPNENLITGQQAFQTLQTLSVNITSRKMCRFFSDQKRAFLPLP